MKFQSLFNHYLSLSKEPSFCEGEWPRKCPFLPRHCWGHWQRRMNTEYILLLKIYTGQLGELPIEVEKCDLFFCQAHNRATKPPQSWPCDKDHFIPFNWLLDRQQNTWNHLMSSPLDEKRFDRHLFVHLNLNFNLELQLERNTVQKDYPLHLYYFYHHCLYFSWFVFSKERYERT